MALKSGVIITLRCMGTDINGVKVRGNNHARCIGRDIDGVKLITSSLSGMMV
jgi:hypothetical protein